MTDQPPHNPQDAKSLPAPHSPGVQPPLPGEGTTGCGALLGGLLVLLVLSVAATAIGFAVARFLGWA
jgi:hypothetical protein